MSAKAVQTVAPTAPDFVWVAEGQHPTVPGCPLSVHRSREGALAAACDLVATILADTPLADAPEAVTVDNWEAVLERLQDYHGAAFCDVTVTRVPLAS